MLHRYRKADPKDPLILHTLGQIVKHRRACDQQTQHVVNKSWVSTLIDGVWCVTGVRALRH